jgi:hypothetical protein
MTAEEELPYLQTFTPLSFSSHVDMVPRDATDAQLLQKHTINLSSTSPPGVFLARIEMVVDTSTLRINSLTVPRLDPAARAELRPFITKLTNPDPTKMSGALRYNINVLSWAMAEWLRIALKRARFWHALASELLDEKAVAESVMKARSRAGRRRKRKAASQVDGDGEGEEAGDEGEGASGDKAVRAADLLPHMGRTAMDIHVPCLLHAGGHEKSSLRVQWRIGFDWTGEAQSKIAVLVGVAGKCMFLSPRDPLLITIYGALANRLRCVGRKADERGSLAAIPALFDKLVRGDQEPLAAVRTVVALLAGEADGL